MDLRELLAFAVKYRTVELHLQAGLPPLMLRAGETEPNRVNVPPLEQKDIDRWLAPLLTESAKETLRFSGKCEVEQEVAGLGKFRWMVTAEKAVVTVPPPPPAQPGLFSKLFGG